MTALTFQIPTLDLYASSETYGAFHIGNPDNALDDACVGASEGSTRWGIGDHFGNEDLMTFSTCGAYSGGTAALYASPDLGGFSFEVSAMNDLEGVIDIGAVDSSVSAIALLSHEEAGMTFSASLGVDAALSVKGGLPMGQPLPVTVQGGASVAWDGWT